MYCKRSQDTIRLLLAKLCDSYTLRMHNSRARCHDTLDNHSEALSKNNVNKQIDEHLPTLDDAVTHFKPQEFYRFKRM